MSLTRAEDVDYEAGAVIAGIDWGGGGKTIVWIWQCINEKAPIFKLLWVERIDTADTDEQWEMVKELLDAYETDFIGLDAGGASDRVQRTQKRYGNRTRRIFYHSFCNLCKYHCFVDRFNFIIVIFIHHFFDIQ